MDSIKNTRLIEDISIRKDFIDLYNSQKNNFAKPLTESDKTSVFFIFTHAPPKFIEEHIEVINYLVEHNNNPNYNMIIDRYFCNKYGETPLTGIYCKKNISLLKEFEKQFPKLYNHWRQTNL